MSVKDSLSKLLPFVKEEEGKELFNQFGNFNTAAQASDVLQVLYYELRQYYRAIDYGEKAVAGARKIPFSQALPPHHINPLSFEVYFSSLNILRGSSSGSVAVLRLLIQPLHLRISERLCR